MPADVVSTGLYQLEEYWSQQAFDANSAGRDNGAAGPDLGRT
jgi:hypothetical protein